MHTSSCKLKVPVNCPGRPLTWPCHTQLPMSDGFNPCGESWESHRSMSDEGQT